MGLSPLCNYRSGCLGQATLCRWSRQQSRLTQHFTCLGGSPSTTTGPSSVISSLTMALSQWNLATCPNLTPLPLGQSFAIAVASLATSGRSAGCACQVSKARTSPGSPTTALPVLLKPCMSHLLGQLLPKPCCRHLQLLGQKTETGAVSRNFGK